MFPVNNPVFEVKVLPLTLTIYLEKELIELWDNILLRCGGDFFTVELGNWYCFLTSIIEFDPDYSYMCVLLVKNDNQDPKQVTTVHNSHVIALSQVCPNNLNGGSLT